MANVTIADIRNANPPAGLSPSDLIEGQQGGEETAFTLGEVAAFVGLAGGSSDLQTITSRDWNLPGTLTPSALGAEIQNMLNYCAANGFRVVFMPDEFVIDRFSGDSHGGLLVPANSNIHFMKGSLLKRAPYEATGDYRGRTLSLGRDSHNVTMTGTLEIDGTGDSVTWYNEHSHNLFIYGCVGVDARGLTVISYNSMGDCVSISGASGDKTKRVEIGSIIASKKNSLGVSARRSSLVLEGVQGCRIGYVEVDNGDSTGIHYEPFSQPSNVIDVHIDYAHTASRLHCASPSSDVANIHRNTKLRFNTLSIEIPQGSTFNSYCVDTWACDVTIGQLRIDYRYSDQPNIGALRIRRGGKFTVGSLQIRTSDLVAGRTISNYAEGCIYLQTIDDLMGELKVDHLEMEGAGDKVINNRGCVFLANTVDIEGAVDMSTGVPVKIDLSDSGYFSQMTSTTGHTRIGLLRVKNVIFGRLVYIKPYNGRIFRTEIGRISITDEEAGNPNGSISNGTYNNNNVSPAYLAIGAVDVIGEPPTAFYDASGGHGKFHMQGGGRYQADKSDPHDIVAVAGATCSCSNGSFWVKTVTDDGAGNHKHGWLQLATV